ncbi:MAG TPA: transglycosylase SLT domain-containing protein [Gemmatimonadaceae bacterium]|nr:transglycosylase SLT domain-containing protein [Gemmatimonadaceae bacterium]
MTNRTERYARRGDRKRRFDKVGKAALVVAVVGALALIARQQPEEANASALPSGGFSFGLVTVARHLNQRVDALEGELQLAQSQLDRANAIIGFSGRYHIGADIASDVYDVALAEGIEPELGFRLVDVESQFHPRATSSAGAIGLTQIEPGTARYFDKEITREQLYDRRTNLHYGFRHLHSLLEEYHGDVTLALLVYNRGPVTVESMRLLGQDPRNGYEQAVARGYHGKGKID